MALFDLDKAMALGGRCIDTNGNQVRIICTDRKGDYPIVALVHWRPDDVSEDVRLYDTDGTPLNDGIGSLMNLPNEGWVNIYPDNRVTGGVLYDTKLGASSNAGPGAKQVHVTWE